MSQETHDVTIRLKPPQLRVFSSRERFRVLAAGRRFGKTYLSIVEMMVLAINSPGSVVWYVGPTYRQAKTIAWATLREMVPRPYVRATNETELLMTLRNGSTIALHGADRPDSLRGPGLDFVVMDEVAHQRREGWFEVLRPALTDRLGRALFISTPSGHNWFYDLHLEARSRPGWAAFRYTTLEGGNVSPSEIEEVRGELDDRTFRQEMEASFEAAAGRVYSSFSMEVNVLPAVDPGGDLLVGMDFNVSPMSAVLAVRVAGTIHVLSEIVIPNGNTEDMARAVKSKYPDRRVIVYPDPTGNARKTSAPVGQTDFTILRQAGFQVRAPASPYLTPDKINTTNAALRNAAGVSRLFVAPECRALIRGLDGLVYRQGTSEPDKSGGLDHITDALAYLVCGELPLTHRLARVGIRGV